MKEMLGQYGQSIVAIIIALLIFSIIGGKQIGMANGIYAATGQLVSDGADENQIQKEDVFERYWRLR